MTTTTRATADSVLMTYTQSGPYMLALMRQPVPLVQEYFRCADYSVSRMNYETDLLRDESAENHRDK